LVGTISIENSERLADLLKRRSACEMEECGEYHPVCALKEPQVLNAKHHEREAEIVAQAGRKGALTIATNMAGRGTDIMLGGNPDMLISQLPKKLSDKERETKSEEIRNQCKAEHNEVTAVGGLFILSSERHESRRIDNQLRGRAGRQGDPGSTRFYLSMEDDLMRIFGGEKMQSMLTKMGFEKGEVIEHPWVSKAIENSQKKVEGRNFDIRKQLLEYDDVMNQQRDVIYTQRRELLEADDVSDVIEDMRRDYALQLTGKFISGHAEEWDLDTYKEALEKSLTIEADVEAWRDDCEIQDTESMAAKLTEALEAHMVEKEEVTGAEQMHGFEKWLLLNVLDHHWKEHLLAMDHLRQSVGLRGYAQKQPLQEYKRESFELFSGMIDKIREEAMITLHSVQIEQPEAMEQKKPKPKANVSYSRGEDENQEPVETYKRDQPKVGRNDPCPCGSGKKYKQCHGKR
ncbi:MAG: SEC-C metal-binding domain-containing protein, partial [Mariprofundaceae bacterium]